MKYRNSKYRRILPLLLAIAMIIGLTACGGSEESPEDLPASTDPPQATTQTPETPPPPPETPPEPTALEEFGLDENLRFLETRSITVEIYDRANDPGTPPYDNFYTDFIKQGVLEKHNIEVEFVPVGRWTEGQDIANLLAAGTAPDVCVTYSYPTIETYGKMGGIYNMAPLLMEHGNMFPNLFDLLGTTNIYWNQDPDTGHVWAVEAFLRGGSATSVATFVRDDWLKALELDYPTTLQEFEDVLVAFRDNAELLLGSEAGRMIPLLQTHDVRWGYRPVLDGFLPDSLTDKERYIHEAVEGMPTHPAAKEAARTYNKWFNMDLLWKDFSMYDNASLGEVATDLLKAGYVGATMGNHDLVYRGGEESIHAGIQRAYGEDAGFIAVNPFPNDSGKVVRLTSPLIDRKVFFPATNDEPLASLLYLDFISTLEVRRFLQIGEEGETHEVEDDGAIRIITSENDKIMNSPRNIDYTITLNGLDLGDERLNLLSEALGYPGTDPSLIQRTFDLNSQFNRFFPRSINVGAIESAEGIMDEMNFKRDTLFITSIVASEDQFDSVWEAGIEDLLRSGVQAILDEREAKWDEFIGGDWLE